MGLFSWLTGKSSKEPTTKMPTTQQDYISYTSGGNKEFDDAYNEYVASVESLDKAVRIVANVASMARMNIFKESTKGELKPLKVKNVDLKYHINERDSQTDFIKKIFSSIFTQGAAIIIAEEYKKTKMISFYPYDPSRFAIDATENSMIDSFKYTSAGGSEVEFKPEDVIYITDTIDLKNLAYPVSRLKSLNDILLLQANIMIQQQNYYKSGSKNSVIISPKEPLGGESIATIKQAFNDFIQSNETRTLFLNSELSVQSVSNAQTPKDILEAIGKINNIIVEQFGIPAYLWGDYSGYVNDAAVKSAAQLFFQIQLKPVFESIAHQFTKYFRETLELPQAVVQFTYDDIEILEDSYDNKIENGAKLYKLGAISMNEFRAMAELEPLPDEAANYHNLPAYLTGQVPIAVERYDEAIADLRNPTSTDMPNGNVGGGDNTNLETGSQGGPQDAVV